ncbi:FG-GAP repeat domain-containing protein [Numidum massiliense]|uniref:FG-GAP repeat domain-containing protein n=1 Tax=Numidum massiliense TaxID=1522315 RepID=UPI0006D54668|nr:VCBS repeat-containing protein [Numidum massiliense]
MKRAMLTICLCSIIVSFVGCGLSPEELIQPPKFEQNKADLKTEVERSLPHGAVMVAPLNGKKKQLFSLVDLGRDEREAVVFYKEKEEDAAIYLAVFTKRNGVWKKADQIKAAGSEVDLLAIEDVTNDGRKNIIVGYANGDALNKGLVVYNYKDGKLKNIFEKGYSYAVIEDLNRDGIKDISLITLERDVTANVVLYQTNRKNRLEKASELAIGTHLIEKTSELALGPFVKGYDNIISGKVSKTKRGILIDAAFRGRSAFTELIVVEKGKLKSVFGLQTERLLFKERQVFSKDIDGDGILEIGLTTTPKGWGKEPTTDTPYFETYYEWDGKKDLKLKHERYADYENGFYVDFPPEWYERVTIEKVDGGNWIRLVSTKTGDNLLEVRYIKKGKWKNSRKGNNELIQIHQSDKFIYAIPAAQAALAPHVHLIAEDVGR